MPRPCVAEALLCGALITEQPSRPGARHCYASTGAWKNLCVEASHPLGKREEFVHKRIVARSPGARVVLGNGGHTVKSIGLPGWASIEG